MAKLSREETIKLFELVQEENDDDLVTLLAFNSFEFKKLTKQYALGFDGKTDKQISSAVVRCCFDNMPWSYEHKLQDLAEGIFLKRETVYSVFEFAKDKVLVATRKSVLLFHGR